MSNILTEPRNYRLDDVELNWAKLSKPVNPFGTEQWEIQVATKDEKVAKDWKDNYLNVKEGTGDNKGTWSVQLKRKVKKADGSENGKVRVVGRDAKPIEATNLGNGSKGNVILYQYPYDAMGRKGVATSLTAVQVSNFIEYNSNAFDSETANSFKGKELNAKVENSSITAKNFYQARIQEHINGGMTIAEAQKVETDELRKGVGGDENSIYYVEHSKEKGKKVFRNFETSDSITSNTIHEYFKGSERSEAAWDDIKDLEIFDLVSSSYANL